MPDENKYGFYKEEPKPKATEEQLEKIDDILREFASVYRPDDRVRREGERRWKLGRGYQEVSAYADSSISLGYYAPYGSIGPIAKQWEQLDRALEEHTGLEVHVDSNYKPLRDHDSNGGWGQSHLGYFGGSSYG